MSPEISAGLFALSGAFIGGIISHWLQKQKISSDMLIALESIKTEHMAEKTALYYLNHKGYTDRSFELLRKRLGGFTDDELRKILVRSGAVRYIREDDTEWWRLLARAKEASFKKHKEDLGPHNQDL